MEFITRLVRSCLTRLPRSRRPGTNADGTTVTLLYGLIPTRVVPLLLYSMAWYQRGWYYCYSTLWPRPPGYYSRCGMVVVIASGRWRVEIALIDCLTVDALNRLWSYLICILRYRVFILFFFIFFLCCSHWVFRIILKLYWMLMVCYRVCVCNHGLIKVCCEW